MNPQNVRTNWGKGTPEDKLAKALQQGKLGVARGSGEELQEQSLAASLRVSRLEPRGVSRLGFPYLSPSKRPIIGLRGQE